MFRRFIAKEGKGLPSGQSFSMRRFGADLLANVLLKEMQAVLDDYMAVYNPKRPHQDRGVNGRTPWQAFQNELPATGKARRIS